MFAWLAGGISPRCSGQGGGAWSGYMGTASVEGQYSVAVPPDSAQTSTSSSVAGIRKGTLGAVRPVPRSLSMKCAQIGAHTSPPWPYLRIRRRVGLSKPIQMAVARRVS